MTRFVDTLAAAHAARVRPATIRSWAHRGHLERAGTDPKGRALYVLDDVYRTAATHRRRSPVDDQPGNVQHLEAVAQVRP